MQYLLNVITYKKKGTVEKKYIVTATNADKAMEKFRKNKPTKLGRFVAATAISDIEKIK